VIAPGIAVVPVRSPTLAPATHTNTWILGEGSLTIVDPASPWEDEQHRLHTALAERVAGGERIERIVLTHHHGDHVGGAMALKRAFGDTPIAAHPLTGERLSDQVHVDETLTGGATLGCGGRTFEILFTPGHAPGHVALLDLDSRAVVAGDLVAGIGTILIDPRDGDLATYLSSLESVRAHAPSVLLPAHGPALPQADAVLAFYVAHRHQRTAQIQRALDERGAATALELAAIVYPELDATTRTIGAVQITAHLLYLQTFGLAVEHDQRWSAAR
jgi:ribonuclease/clavin/mitogillin